MLSHLPVCDLLLLRIRYAWPVNNSAYCNVVAGIALSFAAEAADILGYEGDVYSDFVEKANAITIPFEQSVPGAEVVMHFTVCLA